MSPWLDVAAIVTIFRRRAKGGNPLLPPPDPARTRRVYHKSQEFPRQRPGAHLGRPASERRDVLGVLADALEPGQDHDVALIQRRLDAAGRDVDDASVAVLGGRDDAGLRARERPGRVAEVVDGHGQQRETSLARSSSSSVVSPIAETMTVTS